jgi:4-carboxymuconolactone decarboxylase
VTSEMFEKGLALRKELVGEAAVAKSFADPDDFGRPMQELVTEQCWGAIWTRPGLDRRSRSLLNLGMLAAANRPDELAGHIRVGLKNGLTRTEIQECFLQVAIYLGMPAGLGCFRIAKAVFDELDR